MTKIAVKTMTYEFNEMILMKTCFLAIRVIVQTFLKDVDIPPAIQTVRKNVMEDAKVKKWLNSRPVSKF